MSEEQSAPEEPDAASQIRMLMEQLTGLQAQLGDSQTESATYRTRLEQERQSHDRTMFDLVKARSLLDKHGIQFN